MNDETDMKLSLIEWQNIYYMLCFAVDEISYMTQHNISYEDIHTTADLFGKLLHETFFIVYNEQMLRQYIRKNYDTNRPRGRLNIERSYISGVLGKGQLNCDVLKFDINNIYNQAIKAGYLSLLNFGVSSLLSDDMRTMLSRDLELLSGVSSKLLTPELIGDGAEIPLWYKPIRFVLMLIYYHHMANDKDGNHPLYNLSERDRLCWIFEKFVRNYCYYKYSSSSGLYVSQPYYWEHRQKNHDRKCELDLLLENQDFALVVDMKWYEANRGNAENIRQIKEYMQGYQQRKYGRMKHDMDHVNGLLLYADTNTGTENSEYSHFGTGEIYWNTIGLKQDWDKILSDLDEILLSHMKCKENASKTYLEQTTDNTMVGQGSVEDVHEKFVPCNNISASEGQKTGLNDIVRCDGFLQNSHGYSPLYYDEYLKVCSKYSGIHVVLEQGVMESHYTKRDGRWVRIDSNVPLVPRFVSFDKTAELISQGSSRFKLSTDFASGHSYVCGPNIDNLMNPLLGENLPCICIDKNGKVLYSYNASVRNKEQSMNTEIPDDEIIT